MIVTDRETLKKVSEPFNFQDPQRDALELAAELVKEMVDANGLGLSAIQIGIPLRVVALRSQPKHLVLFNPKIVHASKETEVREEGCLSLPNLVMKVRRPFQVRVRYQLNDGSTKTETWGGLTARIIQHECDHLDGVIFSERATRFHREQAERRRERIIRQIKSL